MRKPGSGKIKHYEHVETTVVTFDGDVASDDAVCYMMKKGERGRVNRFYYGNLLALVATILTSFLPVLNKQLLRDAPPSMVARVTNAAS